jgi:2-oxoglutarate dehydrogenase E2 component (dihydrolipoamide succinyltransferase)
MSVEITVPEAGESISEVQVLRWKVAEGDHVDVGDELVEIETEKATLPISAPASGVLGEILVGDGEFTEVGDVLARIDEGSNGAARKGEKHSDGEDADEGQPIRKTEEDEEAAGEGDRDESNRKKDKQRRKERKAAKKERRRERRKKEMTPDEDVKHSAKRRDERRRQEAATDDIDEIDDIEDSDEFVEAPNDRIAREVTAEPHRRERREPMTMLRRTIARRLVAAQQQMALVTTFNEVDMQRVLTVKSKCSDSFKQRHGVKLGLMSFFVKAVVAALQDCPRLNAAVRDDDIVYRDYIDVAVAMDTSKGLVVPVVRNCHALRFAEIERAIDDLAARAREGTLGPEELTGGTFTISNGGIFGSLLSTPIINPPQSGVLGLHAIEERPIAREGRVVVRPMMYVALTYDHRIVDGREAVGFLRRVKEVLEMPSRLLLDA